MNILCHDGYEQGCQTDIMHGTKEKEKVELRRICVINREGYSVSWHAENAIILFHWQREACRD